MMNKVYILFLACLLISINISFSQNATFFDASTKKIIKKADRLINEPTPQYQEALALYLEAKSKNLKHATLDFRIALCYLNGTQRANAIRFLEFAYRDDQNIDPEVLMLLGIAYHLNERFEKAIDYFNQYKSGLSEEELQKKKVSRLTYNIITRERGSSLSTFRTIYNLGEIIDRRIQECENGIKLTESPQELNIRGVGNTLNSDAADFAPVINADESVMYFTSRREESTGGNKDDLDNQYYEDIYKSKRAGSRWSPPENIGKPVNSRFHESALALSADGQTMFVFKDDRDKVTDNGDIFMSSLEGEKWGDLQRMPAPVNSDYSERAVALSGDERTLFVVSDRPGGYGKDDIYITTKNSEDKWSDLVNLGSEINTKYDERGIFFHPDGTTLYFSSQGHNSMGGYDIFKVSRDSLGNWGKPENMGYPLNTPDDDIYFVLNSKGTRGYYSSAKDKGVGEKDIYVIEYEKEQPKKFVTILTGFITDQETKEPLKASIQLVDNNSHQVIGYFRSNSKTGKYLVSLPSGKNYGISVRKEGYLFHSENFDIPKATAYQEIRKDIELARLDVGSKVVLRNIFFDFDRATIRRESEPELETLLNILEDNPTMVVEISGHTDNKGNPSYNQRLSEARAQSVVNYLIEKGVDKDRLQAKGYGETRPIAKNSNEDGTDNEEGRALNRRTEFEILSK